MPASGFRSTSAQLCFPPSVHCFVYDNLNACADRAHTTYTISPQTEAQMRELFSLMGRYFVAPVYTCSALATRWDLSSVYDDLGTAEGQKGPFCIGRRSNGVYDLGKRIGKHVRYGDAKVHQFQIALFFLGVIST